MTWQEDWDNMTTHEKIMTFPERHSHTFKCVLYLAIFRTPSLSWTDVDLLMRRMGFERMEISRVTKDGSLSLSAPTYACPDDLIPERADGSEPSGSGSDSNS